MNRQFPRRAWLPAILLLLFAWGANAQETADQLAVSDQRRIIEILLDDKFNGSSEETIYISTANLAAEIQKDFPRVKDKKLRLVSPEAAKDAEICAYEFGKFEFIDKFVSVTFGSCREGLAYDFIKDAGGWKTVGLVVTREIYY